MMHGGGEVEVVVGRVGGLDSIATAKGKSAVMNNVCKSEEGVKGGRGVRAKKWEGGAGSCLLRSCLHCHFPGFV